MEQRTLKGIRGDLNLSQDEMAQAIGCSRISYMNKEKGKTALLACELVIVSKLSGVPMEQIKIPK